MNGASSGIHYFGDQQKFAIRKTRYKDYILLECEMLYFFPLSANSTKWSKTLKQFVGNNLQIDCNWTPWQNNTILFVKTQIASYTKIFVITNDYVIINPKMFW